MYSYMHKPFLYFSYTQREPQIYVLLGTIYEALIFFKELHNGVIMIV